MKKLLKFLGWVVLAAGAVYGILFTVFYFDLDGKAIFHFVEPMLVKHYDKMERKDPLKKSYDIDKPTYEYKV